MEMFGILVGIGVFGVLIRMSNQLGALTNEVRQFRTVLDDHEHRLRKLEDE